MSEPILPRRTAAYLENGASEGERNAELFAAAQQLRDAGYSETQAAVRLSSRAEKDGLGQDEISRTIQSAYSREPREPFHKNGQTAPASSSLPDPIADGLKILLESCFKKDEGVAISDTKLNGDGVPKPGSGRVYSREVWLKQLVHTPINEIYSQALDGLFIRINPITENGKADKDVTFLRHCLAEFDRDAQGNRIPKEIQYTKLVESNLPISVALDSGDKSIHGWVRLDAPNRAEYDRRRAIVWEYFRKVGLPIDENNKNPSRYSRCPGVERNLYDKDNKLIGTGRQELLAVSLGAASWEEWENSRTSVTVEESYTRAPWPSAANPEEFTHKIFYPENSILHPFMEYGHTQSEGANAYLLGSIVTVCGALLARRVYIDFGSPLYPNLFSMIAGRPGDRKSFTINLAKRIARLLLMPNRFLPALTSVEGLYSEYAPEDGGNPDKLCIVDDAAGVLSTWRTSAYGERVATRMLELYDCPNFTESFRRNLKEAAKKTHREIPETSTALLFGATFADALFPQQKIQQGIARRFLYYIACGTERTIYWPKSENIQPIAALFKPLLLFKGALCLESAAYPRWCSFQDANRARIAKVPETREDLAHALASEPTHVLKIAAIFQAAISAAQRSPINPTQITLYALECAISHVAENLRAAEYLFQRACRFEARQQGEEILARIRNDFPWSKRFPDTIFVNRSRLTSAFCHHTTRKGALTVDDLYLRIIPELIRRGQAQLCLKKGKFEVYAFKVSDSDDDDDGPEDPHPPQPPHKDTPFPPFPPFPSVHPGHDAPTGIARANSTNSTNSTGTHSSTHTPSHTYADKCFINTIYTSNEFERLDVGVPVENVEFVENRGVASVDSANSADSDGGPVREAVEHVGEPLADILAFDIETCAEPKIGRKGRITSTADALDPFKGDIRLLTLCDSDEGNIRQLDLRETLSVPAEILSALANSKLIIHNAAFELRFLAAKFGLWPENVFCTLTASRLLEPLKSVRHLLGPVLERYLDVKLAKGHGATDWGSFVLTDCQLQYARDDVRYLHRLANVLTPAITEAGLERVFALELALLPIIVRMELHGFSVNVEQLRALVPKQKAIVAPKLKAVRGAFGKPTFNPNSDKQVLKAFKEVGIKLVKVNPDGGETETTDEEMLCAIDDPRAQMILDARKPSKLLSALQTLLNATRRDGKIYAQFNPLGTVTGRFSSKGPNLQQVPKKKAKHVRGIFIPSASDRRLIVVDYSQIELRVAALIAGETVMIEAFKGGIDLHSKIASVSLQIPLERVTGSQRDVGKTINFGFIYGRSAEGYRRGARKDYGLVLTPEQAQDYRNAFFETYPAIAAWHEECERKSRDSRNNEARTVFGRLLRAQKDKEWARFNLLTNYTVQGSCADLLNLAMVKVASVLPSDAHLVATVHDELIYDVPAELAQQYCDMIRRAMEEAFIEMFGAVVPIVAEAKVCTNWGAK